MKRTPEDDLYAERFGERLEEAYRIAKSKNVTDEKFANSIGVKRSQLGKYLRGASVPSVRTVALALRNYGIRVAYERVDVAKVVGAKQAKEQERPRYVQLRLPFSLVVADPDKFEVELKSLKPKRYELRIRAKRVG